MKKGYLAYNLTKEARESLLKAFPNRFDKVIAHHVTFQFGVAESQPLPPKAKVIVVGYSFNNNIECVVVSVNGSTQRPDGKTYHITLSHNNKAKPVDSNKLIEDKGYVKYLESLELETIPTFNPL